MKYFAILVVLAGMLLCDVASAADGPPVPGGNPHLQATSADLQAAQVQLALAPDDKAGHRAKATVLVNQALKEVQATLPEPKKY